jgi:transcriptional regulator with XRE-family HTH domain
LVVPTDPWKRRTKEIADALRHHRAAAGLTQEQLAHAAGISRNHLQLLERGVGEIANPRLATIYALANALGVAVIDLLPRDVG